MTHESPRRILIVEDDDAIRESLAEVLVDSGYVTDCAGHGQEALDRLRAGGGLPELILLDLAMPVMDGFQLSCALAEDAVLRDIPIIIMSAAAQIESKLAQTGARGYLKKPMSLEAVLAAVTRCLSPSS